PVHRYKIEMTQQEKKDYDQFRLPAWFWNSYEWSSFTLATGKTQRPILRRALRELKGGVAVDATDCTPPVRIYFSTWSVSLKEDINIGVSAFKDKPGRNEFGRKVQSFSREADFFANKATGKLKLALEELSQKLSAIAAKRFKTFEKNGET